jgi:glycosyltransferase involved in cell wall biosynthesis
VNVLYCADTRFPIERANGVQTMATCHALAMRGHDVTLLTRPDTAAEPRDPFAFYGRAPLDRLRFERVPASAGGRAARVRFLLHAAARAAQTGAILFTRDLGLAAFLVQMPSPRRPRVIYESHGLSPTVSEELPRLLGRPELTPSRHKLRRLDRREQRVWRRAAAYVTITRALADELASRYGRRERLFVVPDGAVLADTTATPPPHRPARDAGPAVAGYAGHLYPWKGVDVFVRALALIPHIRGLIVGGHPRESDRERIDSLIATLGLRDRIDVTGLVPPGEVARHLCRSTLLVLPNTASAISERYTSPLKLFEYLTLGRPIVASDLPSVREVLTPGETALLVPPGDPRALAAAIGQLATDPELSARLGAAARALAPAYTWEARAERLEPALAAAAAA